MDFDGLATACVSFVVSEAVFVPSAFGLGFNLIHMVPSCVL